MEETLEMMRSIVVGYEKDMSLCKLLLEYQEHQTPNILAFLFVQNYGLIVNISKKYNLLGEPDIASFSLQELDKCALHYDETIGAQFNTYFCACLKNRLRHEQQFLTTDLKFANYNIVDIGEYMDLPDDNFSFDVFDLNNHDLTNEEKKQCNLILDGYSHKEIANMFGLSVQAIYYRNKIIGKKLLNGF